MESLRGPWLVANTMNAVQDNEHRQAVSRITRAGADERVGRVVVELPCEPTYEQEQEAWAHLIPTAFGLQSADFAVEVVFHDLDDC